MLCLSWFVLLLLRFCSQLTTRKPIALLDQKSLLSFLLVVLVECSGLVATSLHEVSRPFPHEAH